MPSTFVSSYSAGQKATKEAYTQEKMNACLKSLEDAIDTWQPDETKQDFYDFVVDKQPYYYGFTKTADVKPQEDIPITLDVCGVSFLLGKLDSHGVFLTTKQLKTVSDVSEYQIVSIATEHYTGPREENKLPPEPQASRTSTKSTFSETFTDVDNGGVIREDGEKEHVTYTSYYDLTLHNDTQKHGNVTVTEYWWEATKQTRVYDINTFKRELDLSDCTFSVDVRYLKR